MSECENYFEFISYFKKMTEKVKNLHQKRIFIGDFNANNIMIDDNDEPVFIDTINYATDEFSKVEHRRYDNKYGIFLKTLLSFVDLERIGK